MTKSKPRLDPELLQARWVLGGVGAYEWVEQAALALDLSTKVLMEAHCDNLQD
jgi:hypothetical protein